MTTHGTKMASKIMAVIIRCFIICLLQSDDYAADKYKYLDGSSIYNKMINHESIHEQQILDFTSKTFPSWLRYTVGSICFYLLYGLEWLFKLIPCLIKKKNAYRSLCAEQEAYNNEMDFKYIENRPKLFWLKKIFILV